MVVLAGALEDSAARVQGPALDTLLCDVDAGTPGLLLTLLLSCDCLYLRTELGDLLLHRPTRFSPVQVHQSFSEPIGPVMASCPFDEPLGEGGENGGATAMTSQVRAAGEPISLVQPPASQRFFRRLKPGI